MKKISNVILKIFAIGIIGVLFAGGLAVIGYIIAICIGGTTATEICKFVFTKYLPYVIKFTCIFTGIGLIGLYLSNQKALVFSNNKNKQKCGDDSCE